MLPLAHDEVHVWYMNHAALACPQPFLALLSAEEEAQHRRFYFQQDRDAYLVTRGMLRSVLSRYLEGAPHDWHFQKNAYGRPYIDHPAFSRDWFFNLSHTRGMTVCALARFERIGIDVESGARDDIDVDLASIHFTENEQTSLLALSPASRRREFLRYWTLKEAYVKAMGRGLSLPLTSIEFDGIGFGPTVPARLLTPAARSERWTFRHLVLDDAYLVSLAMHPHSRLAPRTSLRRWSITPAGERGDLDAHASVAVDV